MDIVGDAGVNANDFKRDGREDVPSRNGHIDGNTELFVFISRDVDLAGLVAVDDVDFVRVDAFKVFEGDKVRVFDFFGDVEDCEKRVSVPAAIIAGAFKEAVAVVLEVRVNGEGEIGRANDEVTVGGSYAQGRHRFE